MTSGTRPLWAGRALALVGIALVAFNLRTGVASLSPIISRVEHDIALDPAVVGLVGMLPPLCFAAFGIATPPLAKRFGLEPLLVGALLALTAGLAWRGLADSALALVAAGVVIFATTGIGNVLLPPLVKRYFPDRIGLVTTIYVTAMSISTFIPPLVAVPVADAAGWRVSIGAWAFVAVVSVIPWIALLVHPKRGAGVELPEEPASGGVRRMLRSSVAWSLAVIFIVSSFNAYSAFAWLPRVLVDIAGVSPAQAGALLSLYAAMGLPAGILVPIVAARYGRVRLLVAVSMTAFVLGYLGLLFVPETATWLWVALAGIGPLMFPLALVLINLRSRTHAGAVALSGFVQSVGYLVAAAGPLVVGFVHAATGGWTVPILILLASIVPGAIAGVVAARPRYVEDHTA
ncbi:MFS transporter [Agromyces endophyticus]|uniref:MFS transporter n=1 Tax=Agromyces sp. H17E-10 TaxID=2932244 RepID=UPI001FD1BBB6|nr:MFS transporter [Agromyces sp. H17E-10]UOQ89643.1 MFS transporter [Agromyces sp. H17E-10]